MGGVAPTFRASIRPEATWIQASTIGHEATGENARLAAIFGINVVDAPVLGTTGPAETGSLVTLVACKASRLDKLHHVFASYAHEVVYAGKTPGSANALKLACNTWIALLTAGTTQALHITAALGLDPHPLPRRDPTHGVQQPIRPEQGRSFCAGGEYTTQVTVADMIKDLNLARGALPTGDTLALLTTSKPRIAGYHLRATTWKSPPSPRHWITIKAKALPW
ncbi:NAD(P)-binding domain-containing protein [Cellulosimicrobium funkei]|uniref:NAD(P)-binding domain-containing protein n=1 Tax=Cellulosimicrobium funkei TaxID=264251 RepID=UPI0036CA0C3E